ncbi:hypothetical protein DCAR_0205271 [Daucus carota subsp. sativus]|uniref:Uncharacterized protein n=1 Tax=Daucus carota subsp. sativus TaxID=79200 RepID=A0A175YBZ9_DAUCS|nr:hypothetical protein DCAR_0205271 [Daucus carota subsp. sativus]
MESEDSSIQVLLPPPRSPPVVIDLTAPSPLRAETVDPVDTILGMEEPVTSVYAALPIPEAPVCDTAPPTPTIQVSVVTPGLGGLFAPFPVTATGQMVEIIATVPAFQYEELRLSYDNMPAAPVSEDGLVRRSEVIDAMHQTATSVITGLQSAIAELLSSSVGAVDQGAVASLSELTRCEFLSRVDEMFRPHRQTSYGTFVFEGWHI